jgi:GNAT superfamily N-acetyltransferase
MSNEWDQFFGLRPREHHFLSYPTWMEHYASTVEVPLWLAKYKLVHIANQAEHLITRDPVIKSFDDLSEEENAVHLLYRSFFKDIKDRKDMLLALEIGHTIAIVQGDETESLFAAAAITFMYSKNNGIALYFVVHDDYRRSGFGTYLLYLMGKAIVHRSGKDHAAIHLMANELLNPVSMSFYTKLGFEIYVDPNHEGTRYPKPVLTIMKCTSVFNTFFIQDDNDEKDNMVWLSIEGTETLRNSSTWHMSLINPDYDVDEETGKATICDNVFCQYPNGITYDEYDCINEGLFAFEKDVFFNDVVMANLRTTKLQMTRYEMNSLIRVSVAERHRLRSNDHIPPLFVELMMNWLQGDFTNNLWNKITFIPFYVVQHANTMQNMLQAYFISVAERIEYKKTQEEKAKAASQGNASDVESDNETDESMFQVFFHDVLDDVTFMECAEIVYGFIFAHQDMFAKPYILQMYCEVDKSWSCQVSVNAGKIDLKDQPIKDELVRGFFSFDPFASVQDQHDPYLFLATSLSPSNPFLFFLTIAFNLLRRESDVDSEKSTFVDCFASTTSQRCVWHGTCGRMGSRPPRLQRSNVESQCASSNRTPSPEYG